MNNPTYTVEEIEAWINATAGQYFPAHSEHGIAAWKARKEKRDDDAEWLRSLSMANKPRANAIADRLESLQKRVAELEAEPQPEVVTFSSVIREIEGESEWTERGCVVSVVEKRWPWPFGSAGELAGSMIAQGLLEEAAWHDPDGWDGGVTARRVVEWWEYVTWGWRLKVEHGEAVLEWGETPIDGSGDPERDAMERARCDGAMLSRIREILAEMEGRCQNG